MAKWCRIKFSMSEVLVNIPDDFAEGLVNRFGDEARGWLRDVPRALGIKLKDWNLELDGSKVLHGAMGLIFFVKRGGEKLVLKLSWRDELTESENKALKLWNGVGAVRLIDYDPEHHVSLMERLSSRSLNEISPKDAGNEAGKLIRKLGIKVSDGFPKLKDRLENIKKDFDVWRSGDDSGIDWDLVDRTIKYREEDIDSYLSHGDIGYLNILATDDGEWKAIDPKPMIGDLEFSVPELMWNRIDELGDDEVVMHLERIVDAGGLDRQKALDWTLIRAVDYYFWGLENGLTTDPQRCLRLYNVLAKELV